MDRSGDMSTSESIKTAALGWLMRLSLEQPTAQDYREFEAWRASDTRHAEAYRRFAALWQDSTQLVDLRQLTAGEPRFRDRIASAVRRNSQRTPVRLAAAVLITGIAIVWLQLSASGHYATGIGETRQVKLADGSEVTLGAHTSLDVSFSKIERAVEFDRGEAFFAVASNPALPFVVRIGDKQVRVVGTQFNVRRNDGDIRVSVVEGVVRVQDRSPGTGNPSAERQLRAGEELDTSIAGDLDQVHQITKATPAAWRFGRLEYVDATLREIVADSNRYSKQTVSISDPGIADLRISVTYDVSQVEQMQERLGQVLPVRVRRVAPDRLVIEARQ